MTSQIINRSEITSIVNGLKKENKKIVLTNGVFDLLHVGHTRYLKKAKELGDVLIVAVNADRTVSKIKGKDRPINNAEDRAELLSSLRFVDYVVIFDEENPISLIREIKPDFHVKGGDYKAKDLPEYDTVIENGGKVVIIDQVAGKSTTNILKKAKKFT